MKNITLDKLYKYLEEKFSIGDERSGRMENRLDTLHAYLEKRFAAHDQQFERVFDQMGGLEDRLQSSINEVQITVDGLAKQYTNLNDERIILHGRVYNLEDWTKKAADKINIPFNQ